MPEEAFHFSRNDYFAAFVMDSCRRMVGQEYYAAVPDLAPDTLPQGPRVNKYKTAGPCRTLAPRPFLREKALT